MSSKREHIRILPDMLSSIVTIFVSAQQVLSRYAAGEAGAS